jgi:signal transduction histidine kinase
MKRIGSSPRQGRRVPFVAIVGLCFALAAASFVGGTFFADARLKRITELTHAVSENAMPSLMSIGTMRHELAREEVALDAAAEGEPDGVAVAERHLMDLERARRTYETLPRFPGERAEEERTQPALDEAVRAAREIISEVGSGDLPRARGRLDEDYVPAEARADSSLRELRRINLDQGTHAAQEADRAFARTRIVSLVLDAACAFFTGALAVLAITYSRRAVKAETRRADELDAFAARVAHDLAAPLGAPVLALHQLARTIDENSPQRSMVDRALRSLRRAEALIRDLLTFARAAAAPEPEAHASLPDVVSGAVQDAAGEAAAAGVRIDVGDLPRREVHCTAGVLSSIIGNLVGNAIKYTSGSPRERLVRIQGAETPTRVHVEVSDTGPGLSGDVQERIFDPYVRADSTRPGLGLGLATVKRLVQSHRGRVGVRSEVGLGSVFWFELPVRDVAG